MAKEELKFAKIGITLLIFIIGQLPMDMQPDYRLIELIITETTNQVIADGQQQKKTAETEETLNI